MKSHILAFVGLIFVSCVLADPCTLTPNFGDIYFGNPDELIQCMNSLTLDKQDAREVVQSLKGLIQLYSFGNLVKDSGPPYNIKVDLEVALNDIYGKISNTEKEYDFHKGLLRTFNPLNDAHTLYRLPTAYSRCFFVRPFSLESDVDDNGNQRFFLRQGPLGEEGDDMFRETFGFDPSKYIGEEIVKADGKPAADYLELFADNYVGYYKCRSARFNAALRSRWSQVNANLFPLDNGLDLKTNFQFRSNEEVEVPNAVVCNGGFKDTEEFMSLNKRKTNGDVSTKDISTLVKRAQEEHIDPHMDFDIQKIIGMKPTMTTSPSSKVNKDVQVSVTTPSNGAEKKTSFRINPEQLKVVKKDEAGQTYFMTYENDEGTITPVYKLTTFLPSNVDESLDVLNEALSYSKTNSHDSIIVDMSFNGGGIVCLADLIAAMFVEEWGNLTDVSHATLGVYDFRQSRITNEMTNHFLTWSLYTNPRNYLKLSDKTGYTDMEFYENGPKHVRGGLASRYTEKLYFPASCVGYPYPGFSPVRHFFKNVYVLTDGACGSACSLFLTQLQSINAATVVSYGGYKGKSVDMDTSSFAGGNVLEWNTVTEIMESTGSTRLPKRFPTTAAARYNYHEYYKTAESVLPREFESIPADYHLDTYSALHNADPNSEEGKVQLLGLYKPTEEIMKKN